MMRLSKKQVLILKAIGKYKFITYSQIVRLGIEKFKNKCSFHCKDLREGRQPLIKKIPHRMGVEAKHYLTKRGKKELLELYEDLDAEKILCPIGAILTDTQDEKHRTTTIDIQIEIDLACEEKQIPVLFTDRYFDKVGNNRVSKNLRSKTAVLYQENPAKSIKADMVFMMQTSTQKELYFVELERGKNTKKSVQTAITYAKCILLGSANEKYNFNSGFRILWVYEHKSIMKAVIERLKENPAFKHLTEYMLFKSLDEIEGKIFEGWSNLAGDTRKIYYNV